MEDVKRALSGWLPVLAYLGIITFLSSRTGSSLPTWSFMKHDKVLHTIEYGGLGFLLCRALGPHVRRPGAQVALAAALGLAFGVLDEFHQSFVAGRNGNDPGDMTADLTGALLGALAFFALRRLFSKGAKTS
ncbi:MAG TPA: VanZ family protein [Polyangia bacterium]